MNLESRDDKLERILVYVNIEKALFGIGNVDYEKVVKTLYRQYNCCLDDCYEHPEHLKRVLNYIYGDAHVLAESLKIGLREFNQNASIVKFLEIMDE
jgi:hypothetical protein